MTERTRFDLAVTLGNDAMQTPTDVAAALRKLADGFDTWHAWPSDLIIEGNVVDLNGSRVGSWEVQ